MTEAKPRNPVAPGNKYRDLDVKYRRRRRVVEVIALIDNDNNPLTVTHVAVKDAKGKMSLVYYGRLQDPSRFELIERPAEISAAEDEIDLREARKAMAEQGEIPFEQVKRTLK